MPPIHDAALLLQREGLARTTAAARSLMPMPGGLDGICRELRLLPAPAICLVLQTPQTLPAVMLGSCALTNIAIGAQTAAAQTICPGR